MDLFPDPDFTARVNQTAESDAFASLEIAGVL